MNRSPKKHAQSRLQFTGESDVEQVGSIDHGSLLSKPGLKGAQHGKRRMSMGSTSIRNEYSEAGPTRELILRLINLFRA